MKSLETRETVTRSALQVRKLQAGRAKEPRSAMGSSARRSAVRAGPRATVPFAVASRIQVQLHAADAIGQMPAPMLVGGAPLAPGCDLISMAFAL